MATKRLFFLLNLLLSLNQSFSQAEQTANFNGDIFVASDANKSAEEIRTEKTNEMDLKKIISICNASFSIPIEYLIHFNETGELPNIVDKTAPCYIRCLYEKSGFIDNWKLNGDRIRQNMWPATGDSLTFCQEERKNETNVCLRTYEIAKCLMLRTLVDARSTTQK